MSALRTPATGTATSPPAQRARRPSWRDPRLAVGLLLVCGSVLLGAKVLAAADDTVAVLAAARPLAAGEALSAGDLTTVRLRFASETDAERYLLGDPAAADGSLLLRPVGAGELVPRDAVGGAAGEGLVELPLDVAPGRVPSTVQVGSVVDVWVAPGSAARAERRPAVKLLTAVPVVAVSRGAGEVTGGRRLVVGIAERDEASLSAVVARLGEDAGVLVVRRSDGIG